jgi:hypothetical protein
MMNTTNHNVDLECKDFLNSFFDSNCSDTLRKRALKALRFLVASDEPLSGEPAGWAAGIVYALANRDRRACGVPGLLNKDLEEFFGVSMGTIRKRAARVEALLAI